MAYNAKAVGERIYMERVTRRMSKKELGDAIGVTDQTISNYEDGKFSPDLPKAVARADLFGMTLDDLFGRKVPA